MPRAADERAMIATLTIASGCNCDCRQLALAVKWPCGTVADGNRGEGELCSHPGAAEGRSAVAARSQLMGLGLIAAVCLWEEA